MLMKRRADIDATTACRTRSTQMQNPLRQAQFLSRIGGVIAMFALWVGFAIADQPTRKFSGSFQVPQRDLAKAEALAAKIAALSPGVDRKEATLLAERAYATVSQLRQHYRMFGTPIFNN